MATKQYTVEIYDKKEGTFEKKAFSNSEDADKYVTDEILKHISSFNPIDIKFSFNREVLPYGKIIFNIGQVKFVLNSFE